MLGRSIETSGTPTEARKQLNLEEAGRQLQALRELSPFSSLRAFARNTGLDVGYLHKAEHGKLPPSKSAIEAYVSASGLEIDQADEARDRILLLTGRAPANLTPAEATTLAFGVFMRKQARREMLKTSQS